MLIRNYTDLRNTDRFVSHAGWTSVRMLLAGEGMGFSFHITVIEPGSEHTFEYKNHLESVYCISGTGTITDHASKQTHAIDPGTMYALDQHDRHTLRAEDELVLACVFNPPVTGREVHGDDGSYPAASPRTE